MKDNKTVHCGGYYITFYEDNKVDFVSDEKKWSLNTYGVVFWVGEEKYWAYIDATCLYEALGVLFVTFPDTCYRDIDDHFKC